jgi:tyrocidine synthetase-3
MNTKNHLEVSYHQQRLWSMNRPSGNAAQTDIPVFHNIPIILELKGECDLERLRKSLQDLVSETKVLRTRFFMDDHALAANIVEEIEINLESEVATTIVESKEKAIEFCLIPFSLFEDALMRFKLFTIADTENHLLVISVHHLIFDRPSIKLFIDSFSAIYQDEKLKADKTISFYDFAKWQRNLPQNTIDNLYTFYWKRNLLNKVLPLNLFDDLNKNNKKYRAKSIESNIQGNSYSSIKQFIANNRLNGEAFFLAIFKLLLGNYCGQEDILCGIVKPNRAVKGTENLIGPVANLLPINTKIDSTDTFLDLAGQTASNIENAIKYQALAYEVLLEKLKEDQEDSMDLPMNVLFQYEEGVIRKHLTESLTMICHESNLGWGDYDLDLLLIDDDEKGEFRCILNYNSKCYSLPLMERFSAHLKVLVQNIVEQKDLPVFKYNYITENEVDAILNKWNDPNVNYPKDTSIVDHFKNTVSKLPNNIAASLDDEHLTYKKLDQLSDTLAARLFEQTKGDNKIIGFLCNRSFEMIIGILAILKSGNAYVPLDPTLPKKRLDYILKDSNPELLLTYTIQPYSLIDFSGERLEIDLKELEKNPKEINVSIDANALAYALYTSGTTGKPKGVLVEHEQVVRLFFNDQPKFDFNENDKWSMFHNFSFDVSIWEIWGALFFGAQLIIVPKKIILDSRAFQKLIEKEKITILSQTPTSFYELSNHWLGRENLSDTSIRKIVFAGEKLNPSKLSSWRSSYPNVQLINMYGITETTIHTTYKEIREVEIASNISNVGLPLPTTLLYLLDAHKKMIPVGVIGEIYVGGKGVARGYWMKDELTNERFINNPWVAGDRIYKSGDLAKRLENGEIEFVGRIDNQIKVRGFRIECDEIRIALTNIEGVKDAFVCARGEGTEKMIYSYFIANQQLDSKKLKQDLGQYLPSYMIPSFMIQVEAFNTTPNGKIDINVLPLFESDTNEDHDLPQNKIEEEVLNLFAEVLGVDKSEISTSASFFDLGGHSLTAIRLLVKIKNLFGVNVAVLKFFKFSDIKSVSSLIEPQEDVQSNFTKAQQKEYYDLSPSQKRIYIQQQLDETALLYNITSIYSLDTLVDIQKINDALNKLVVRHDALRTSFAIREDKPVQLITDSGEIIIEQLTCSEEDIKETVERWVKPFDLSSAPLMRATILRTNNEKSFFVFDIHHIITDGISNAIFIRDFVRLYNGDILPEPELQFKDFSEWQNSESYKNEIEKSKAFWLKKFEGELPTIELPFDFTRPFFKGFDGDSVNFNLDKTISQKVRSLSKSLEITPYNFLLGVFFIFLRKITNQEDIVVGSPSSGRNIDGLENTAGVFINVLAHRNMPLGTKSCAAFLKEVNTSSLDAFENEDYQFEDLVDAVVKVRDISRNPLFDVMFDYHNEENLDNEIEVSGMRRVMDAVGLTKTTAMFDLNWHVYETTDGFNCNLDFSTQLFKPESIDKMTQMLLKIISEVVAQPEQQIANLQVIDDLQRDTVLYGNNDTKLAFDEELLMHQGFEQMANEQPDAIAVTSDIKETTYKELNHLANGIANKLIAQGLDTEGYVAIIMDRSVEMIAAVIGVLKAGGTYVPIEPYLPDGRIETLIGLLDITYFISSYSQTDRIAELLDGFDDEKMLMCVDDAATMDSVHFGKRTIAMVSLESDLEGHNPEPRITSNNYAYVIFTSGSTGVPKGVIVKHRPVINLIEWVNRELNISKEDKILFITSIGFDLSVYDIFGILAAGANIRLTNRKELENPEKLVDIIITEGITIWDSAPAAMQQLLPTIESSDTSKSRLRMVMLSGDWIPITLPDFLKVNFADCEVMSLGGATEATVWSNYFPVNEISSSWVSIPYGKPIQNAKYYILDKYLKPRPVGLAGDLFIGGECLASGYVGDKELTNKKFIENPFCPGEKIYMTGDTARWFEDGNMEFLGRKDNQIKIRGHRIELGEIESSFLTCTNLGEFLILPIQIGSNATDKQLCVYYISANEIDKDEVKAKMATMLPAYMIPVFFLRIEEFPVNQNGKIDRKALPEPSKFIERNETEIELDEIDKKIISFCCEILNLTTDQIHIKDNFFDLGGHSLNSTSLLNKVQNEYGLKVPLIDFFRQVNLLELAECVRSNNEFNYTEIPVAEEKEYYNLSSSQKRLMILHELDAENIGHSFNIPIGFGIEGELDTIKVASIFNQLIERHQSLRTSFHIEEDALVQKIHDKVDFEIDTVTVASEDEILSRVKDSIKPFNLHKAPLLRASIIYLQEEPKAFVIDMHHIISDGVSQQILIQEFLDLYRDISLPELKIQYRDYAEWQFDEKAKGKFDSQKEFWLDQFSDDPQYLKLPTDFSKGDVNQYKGATIKFSIPKDKTAKIYALTKDSGGSLFTTLLGLLNILLSKISSQQDITVGTVTAGRNSEELEKVVGFFLNTLALRNYPDSNLTLPEFLEQVGSNTIAAFDNQDYQYEELVNSLKLDRNTNQNPLFNVVFILQNMGDSEFSIPGLQLQLLDYGYDVAKIDLTFVCTEKDGVLNFELEYSTALFKAKTIDRFINYFKRIVDKTVKSPEVKIGEIDLLDEKERDVILKEFNNTKVPIDRSVCYHQLFEQQVINGPNRIAAVHNDREITYAELNDVSNRIASYLIDHGTKPGEVVGLCFERGIELLVTIIAILKTGASYVAIDHEYPVKRIEEILIQSESRIAIVQNSLKGQFDKLLNNVPSLMRVLHIKEVAEVPTLLQKYSSQNADIRFGTETIAYIIYTSGTTGVPKGIMVHQLGMLNHMYALITELEITDKDRMAQTASCSSDIFVVQLLLTLITGGSISILDKDDILDPLVLFSKMKKDEISLMEIVPSLLTAFLGAIEEMPDRNLTSFRAMLSMGESLKPVVARKWFELYPEIALYNAYGPAEASDDVTLNKINPELVQVENQVSIGYPMENVHIYIMDEKMNLCPTGVLGEICISGIAVGKGYWKDQEKTDKVFVKNPMNEWIQDDDYAILYKTGDLGYWQEDGSLIFEGRKDHMVKIRGFRVEPGDIENAMIQIEHINEATVIDRSYDSGTKYLCAYYTSSEKQSSSAIRQHLLEQLPNYMVPSYLVQLDKIPITKNDKVDRKSLPIPDVQNNGEEVVIIAPATPTEQQIAQIWKSLLGVEVIGTNQSFFLFGGDSIKAINLQSRMRKIGLDLSIKEIYQCGTIKDLGVRIDAKAASINYSYSSYQQAYFDLTKDGINKHSETHLIRLNAPLSRIQLEAILNKLREHHPSLTIGHNIYLNGETRNGFDAEQVKGIYLTGVENNDLKYALHTIKEAYKIEETTLCLGYVQLGSSQLISIQTHPLLLDRASVNKLLLEIDAFIDLGDEHITANSRKYLLACQKNTDQITAISRNYSDEAVLKHLTHNENVQGNSEEIADTMIAEVSHILKGNGKETFVSLSYLAIQKMFGLEHILFTVEEERAALNGEKVAQNNELGQCGHQLTFSADALRGLDVLSTTIEIRNQYRKSAELTSNDNHSHLKDQDVPSILFRYREETSTQFTNLSIEEYHSNNALIIDGEALLIDVVYFSDRSVSEISIHNFSSHGVGMEHKIIDQFKSCLEELFMKCKSLIKPIVTSSDFDFKELSEEDFDSIFD